MGTMGVLVFFGSIAVATGLFVWYHFYSTTTRRDELMAKYHDTGVVKKILAKTIWHGESEEQLMDMLGQPDNTDETGTNTDRRQVWKYGRTGKDHYNLLVTLEHGVVVGWEERV